MTSPTTDLGIKITERFSTNNAGGSYRSFYDSRHRYKQAKPFDLILPYTRWIGETKSFTQKNVQNGGPGDIRVLPPGIDVTQMQNELRNKSYDKLKAMLYSNASLGVDFVEYRQSVSMIEDTALRLAKAARAVRKGNFGAAAAVLGHKIVNKGGKHGVKKSFANNWLEFHFGWEPLIRDIYDAAEVLNNPLKSFTFQKASAHGTFHGFRHQDFGANDQDDWLDGPMYCTQGAKVRAITNVGLHSLEQFGVINPASLAWEVVPFSFVVDWFANVGQFLGSLSDFAGMTLDKTLFTEGWKFTHRYRFYTEPAFGGAMDNNATNSLTYMYRATGLSGITFQVKRLKPPSVARAATAISLLLQAL